MNANLLMKEKNLLNVVFVMQNLRSNTILKHILMYFMTKRHHQVMRNLSNAKHVGLDLAVKFIWKDTLSQFMMKRDLFSAIHVMRILSSNIV